VRIIQTANPALREQWRDTLDHQLFEASHCHGLMCKRADTPVTSMAMTGQLYASKSGWLMLAVPNALVRGVFQALDEPGIELPLDSDGNLLAHISVCRPSELAQLGGVGKITERGKRFHYTVGGLKTVKPLGWEGVSKVWMLSISSPELSALRRSYGLPSLPTRNGVELPFHATVARRAVGVLGRNEVSKAARYITREELLTASKDVHPSPTPGQQDAGNYAKGHTRLHGYDISIENAKGGKRSGIDKGGKAWSVTMKSHYGYIRGSKAKDGDHVDCFIGEHPESEAIFVVDQREPGTGAFDEPKVFFGFLNIQAAKQAYLENYEDGWKGLMAITPMTVSQFDWWLEHGNQKKPVSKQTLKTAADVVFRKFSGRDGRTYEYKALSVDPGRRVEGDLAGVDCPECGSNWTNNCRSMVGDKQCQACGNIWSSARKTASARSLSQLPMDRLTPHSLAAFLS